MSWKIIFTYKDGGKLKISNNQKQKSLTKELAEHYQKEYAKPSNDGGMVYIAPLKNCVPVPLKDFIAESN